MRKIYKLAFVIFIITFSVEVCQFFIGRSSDIDDIITNLLGGIIGYIVFKLSMSVFENKNWWNKFIGNENNLD
jgi:glycopeptide antibiotics resistance protein